MRAGIPGSGKLAALTFLFHGLWLLLVSRLRGCRLIHVQNIDVPLILGLAVTAPGDRKLIVTIHGEGMIEPKRTALLGRLRLRAMRVGTDRFTAITSRVKRELQEIGIDPERISDIPNGVDTDYYRPPTPSERHDERSRLSIDSDALVCVFVGRLVKLKQVDRLLMAWAGVQEEPKCLLIVGDGPENESLRALAARLGIDVRFAGFTEDPRPFLHASDLFVLPSRMEGLSVALLEAMATGLPVVASDLAGSRSVISSGKTGILVPRDGVEPLRTAMLRLAQSTELRRRLSHAARETVLAAYSLAEVARRHAEIYAPLTDRRLLR